MFRYQCSTNSNTLRPSPSRVALTATSGRWQTAGNAGASVVLDSGMKFLEDCFDDATTREAQLAGGKIGGQVRSTVRTVPWP